MASDDVHQIVYMSQATRTFGTPELLEMLAEFRAFNASEDITGLLIYQQRKFMQVIEGPGGPLHALYSRIIADRRHILVLTLVDHPIAVREFADWTMGFPPDFGVEPASVPGYDTFLSRTDLPLEDHPGIALGMLRRFRDQMRQQQMEG